MSPKRHQRKRTRGWRKPPGSVIVDRTSRWGNPFRIGQSYMWLGATDLPYPVLTAREEGVYDHDISVEKCRDAETAVRWYRAYLRRHPELVAAIRRELAGKDVCCPCAEDAEWCHGDDVIRVAAGEEP